MRYAIHLIIVITLLLVACTPQDQPVVGAPFLGGLEGVGISFFESSPPEIVYDGGNFPFDIVVELRNKGEHYASADKVAVKIDGIQAEEFGLGPGDLTKAPPADLLPRKKLPEGDTSEPAAVYVEFVNLNHEKPIAAGAELTYPIRASVCYRYGTVSVTQLCARRNILDPRGTGVCTISGSKPVYNSGAPVQITDMNEQAKGKDKVGFTFVVEKKLETGTLFLPDAACDHLNREKLDKVFIRVIQPDNLPAVSCTGLENGDNGEVKLYNGRATISCTQPIPNPADFEFSERIEINYDYEESVSTSLTVRHADDS